jgi:hypothetical protein
MTYLAYMGKVNPTTLLLLEIISFLSGMKRKAWYNSLAPKSITSKEVCIYLFYNKNFHSSKIHVMITEISNFVQSKEESIPQAWGRYFPLERRCHTHGFKDNEFLGTFYNGLTERSRSYLDNVA